MSTSIEPIAAQQFAETTAESTAQNVAGDTATVEPKKKRTVFVHPKTQKQLDALKTKQDKLIADNKALKQQMTDLKASHSRIRRIPKVPVVPAPEA